MYRSFFLLSIIILFSSCQETKRVFIANTLIDCVGVGPQKCMLYKENPSDKWTYFYDTIEGFEYEDGYNYEIEVTVTKVENPPADGSSLHYSLVKIISKEKNQSIAQNVPLKNKKNQDTIIDIEYQALSRGSFFQIKINNDRIEKTTDVNLKNSHSKKCSKKDWNTIISLLETIDIDKISELKAPTEKRLFDGAPHAQLKITSFTKTFVSNGFDHGHPPHEIQQLVNTILSLAESIE
ncbi:uncharacterized protein DUF4377 [Aquimarina sp. MAR_2010_214]|uniref:DUF4377 domain-containing protein n=1 Tax=Aquimarina sp. MAR_2010_214 TaxID=1250026 RepID=UPI000C7094D9|nr:DUF4377 domain-containing protein [Aquimarina sp. MAR_2010_214]PKV48689.1 uncharacterized protein DUF4377 [Aquimarina sp. MAR_2010_214]